MAGKAVKREEISERAAPPYGKVRTLRQVIRKTEEYPEINPSEKILLLIDECHRSHTLTMHANLMKALPNAAKIGFTGTPIMNRDRGNTLSIFHDFIDKYPLDEAVADEATVKILYEGRVPLGMVENAEQLDALVSLRFAEFTRPEQQIIMRKFADERKVLEAPKLIAAKAHDGTLKEAIEKERNAEITPDDPSFKEVADLTVSLVDGIRTKIQVVDFWRDDQSRLALEKSVYRVLLRSGKVARAKIAELATRIVELARNRHRFLVWSNGKNRDK